MKPKDAERRVLDALRGHLEGVLRERLITFDVAGERLSEDDRPAMKAAVKVVLGVLDGDPVRDRADRWKLALMREQHLQLIRTTMGLIGCLAKGKATLPKAAWEELLPHVEPANQALALAIRGAAGRGGRAGGGGAARRAGGAARGPGRHGPQPARGGHEHAAGAAGRRRGTMTTKKATAEAKRQAEREEAAADLDEARVYFGLKKPPLPTVEELRDATGSYIRATAAYRDAKRLLESGYAAGIARPHAVLVAGRDDDARRPNARMTLEQAIELVIAKEAADLLGLYDRDPLAWDAGRTADAALASARETVQGRYARGRCSFCGQKTALACARRHAAGKSCP